MCGARWATKRRSAAVLVWQSRDKLRLLILQICMSNVPTSSPWEQHYARYICTRNSDNPGLRCHAVYGIYILRKRRSPSNMETLSCNTRRANIVCACVALPNVDCPDRRPRVQE